MNRVLIAKEIMAIARILTSTEFDSQEAMNKYLREHPDADRSKHSVKKPAGGGSGGSGGPGGKKVKPHKSLGELLGQWHSSGSDPIYQVSSHASGGHEVDHDVAVKALSRVNQLLERDDVKSNKSDAAQLGKAKKLLEQAVGK